METPREIQGVSKTPFNPHITTPPVPDTEGGIEWRQWTDRSGEDNATTIREDEMENPQHLEEQPRQPQGELPTLLQVIPIYFQLSQGRIEDLTGLLSELSGTPITTEMTSKWPDLDPQTAEIPYDSRTKDLIDCLTEDPEDNPVVFIPIIELHTARLEKAHLLCAATSTIIQNKWEEGTDLADIGKFLQAWAPEPYRDKPMPRGMIQALPGTASNTQGWSPADLSDCIFRNVEATDTEEDLVRKLNNLGTSGESII